MLEQRIGEFAALATALCWTATAMSFEKAGKKAGSLAVNLIRLVLGFLFLTVYLSITRGLPLPLDASSRVWIWLSISGFIGFAMGDLFLFQAFVVIGARISMLIQAAVPPMTALIGWAIMGETLTPLALAGMGLTVSGIALVVLERSPESQARKLRHSMKGMLMAFGGAVGQAVGLVLSKYGMGDYNAFGATQIRILAGILGFSVLYTFMKRWPKILSALHNRSAMVPISIGAFFGPFLGVSFSLLAVQHAPTGVASTIMAIVPILIIPPAVLFFHERVTRKEILGAFMAVSGVALLFL